jgi:RND family efflux transporter MFP subunit
MSANMTNSNTVRSSLSRKQTLIISLAVLLAGVAVTMVVFFTEPEAKRAGATKKTAMLVDVIRVRKDTFRPTIQAMGTVKPAQDIILSPRVSGEITGRSSSFIPGGYVEKGEMLLQIDPSDYENALELRESELRQAESDLEIEMGRQNVARQDYQLLDENLSKENKALVLREPQLKAARSRVEAARASVDQAQLDLQRTTLRAPFDAHILTRNVNIGSQVAPGDNLGRLVGRDTYWVEATVPLSKLQWLNFPDDGSRGSEVRIKNRTAWPEEAYRKGYLYKLVGTLEERTRMARVLVSVPDPLAYEADTAGLHPLMLGTYVETNILAGKIEDVIRLKRDYIRKNETVWVMENKKLRISDVEIIFRDARYAYIIKGLSEDAQVVTTNLTTVADGAPLRLASDTASRQSTSANATGQ